MLLYYITDRRALGSDEPTRRRRLLEKIAEAARAGVEYIQLREKDLSIRDLESLGRDAVAAVRAASDHSEASTKWKIVNRKSQILVNSRLDVALATGADGVHLPSNDMSPSDARSIFDHATRSSKLETRNAVVASSCHTLDEVRLAESHGADFAVFGPVFEKTGEGVRPGSGLAALRAACHRGAPPDRKTESAYMGAMPVLALGGVTLENARACLDAGAAGIAAIRLFQEHDILAVVHTLRALTPDS